MYSPAPVPSELQLGVCKEHGGLGLLQMAMHLGKQWVPIVLCSSLRAALEQDGSPC